MRSDAAHPRGLQIGPRGGQCVHDAPFTGKYERPVEYAGGGKIDPDRLGLFAGQRQPPHGVGCLPQPLSL